MAISLTPETQRLIEQRMEQSGVDSPDELIRLALQTLDESRSEDYDSLDADTRAAIEEAEAQFERGEAMPWEQVREALRARFVKE